jgi:predicted RNA polymerase sigma factor
MTAPLTTVRGPRRTAAWSAGAMLRLFGTARLDGIFEVLETAFRSSTDELGFLVALEGEAREQLLDPSDQRTKIELQVFCAEAQRVLSGEPNLRFLRRAREDQAALIFFLAHRSLRPESQLGLLLHLGLGLDRREIAAMRGGPEDKLEKELRSACQQLRALAPTLGLPEGARLVRQLDALLPLLYLVFDLGYAGPGPINLRHTILLESLRLVEDLSLVPGPDRPEVHALASTLYFLAARVPARPPELDDLLSLAHQDRARWSRDWLREANRHLELSVVGDVATVFHLEAALLACQAAASRHEDTNWVRVLTLYEAMSTMVWTARTALGRAEAATFALGPDVALEELGRLAQENALEASPILHVLRARALLLQNRSDEAALAFDQAIRHAESPAERAALEDERTNVLGPRRVLAEG